MQATVLLYYKLYEESSLQSCNPNQKFELQTKHSVYCFAEWNTYQGHSVQHVHALCTRFVFFELLYGCFNFRTAIANRWQDIPRKLR